MANSDSEFVDVVDFDGTVFEGYRINRLGRIQSCRQKHPLVGLSDVWHDRKPCASPNGYLHIVLARGQKPPKIRNVHALVLLAFVGPKGDNQACRHLDGNKLNNSVDNLKWGTHKENSDDKGEHGTRARGSMVAGSKLTEDQVREIRLLRRDKGLSFSKLGMMFGITAGSAYNLVSGKTWKHVV